jgi:thiopeptide-type bacteriocin biosynthesis protein
VSVAPLAQASSPNGLDGGRSAGGWWSIHAYADDDAALFRIVDRVAPIAARARRWFYIRYAEGGLHLRVRLQGERDALAPLVDALARAAYGAGAARVRGERYDRETERYGGAGAIEDAEEVFARSTAVARWVLGLSGGDRAAARVGCAGALAALGFLVAAGTPEAARELSALHAVGLAGRLSEDIGREVPSLAPRAFGAASASWWSCAARWMAAVGAPESVAAYRSALEVHLGRVAEARRPYVIGSQIHMTCNRLGVSIVDELKILGALGAVGGDHVNG